ncbi:MAG TPA: fatty acid desaturase family protein [Pararhizobium sp.]|nr:fatty acid desaturase family protein [Pararhizobium sp.]
MAPTNWKNYALSGGWSGASEITDNGIEDRVEQEWFSCKIDRKALKKLIKRSDGPALRHFALWIGLLAASGVAAFLTWGTLWCILPFAVYGVLYSAADHRHHELSHGTPFKTRWINDALFHICAFMTLREGFYYRWSHSRHHTHTLIVGRDPEIAAPRPPDLIGIASDLFFIKDGLTLFGRIFRNASGDLTEDGKHFVPDSEHGKVVWASRLYILAFAGVIGGCVAAGSILPALFVVLPRFYGGPLSQLFNLTQHAGLNEDVYDHRLNTRTVLMNPVFSFLYINMNYHIEHHMFPMVPFYRLPELHELIKEQCPPAYPSLWAAYREIVPALIRQRKDPTWFVQRKPPQGVEAATPVAVAAE